MTDKKGRPGAGLQNIAQRALEEILRAQIEGAPVSARHYRAKNRRQLRAVMDLYRLRMVREKGSNYVVSFWGLMNSRSRLASRSLRDCEAVYKVLARHHKKHADVPLPLAELAQQAKLATDVVGRAVDFLSWTTVSLGTVSDPASPSVITNDYYTEYSFQELVELTRKENTQAVRQVTGLAINERGDLAQIMSDRMLACPSQAVQESWQKCVERLAQDYDGAITAARTLLESVCKHVLDEFGETYLSDGHLPPLYRRAAATLNLAPDQRTEKAFRQVLSGCISVVDGLGQIRNALGDSHGHGERIARPAKRHAELAVLLAAAASGFLLATLDARRGP